MNIGKKLVISLIKVYRALISPVLGNCCRFYPSCSIYMQEAVQKYGFFRGVCLTLRRLLKCHPWSKCNGGYDPID